MTEPDQDGHHPQPDFGEKARKLLKLAWSKLVFLMVMGGMIIFAIWLFIAVVNVKRGQ